jgi:DNA segregation ATPase FtsK/SpoIIIE-like protein
MIDDLYTEAESLVRANPERICISMIQRTFMIGYNRASRIMDDLIENGVVTMTYSKATGVCWSIRRSPTPAPD